MLLEAAYFTPMAIARTGKRLGLCTEARSRFERGTDPAVIDRAYPATVGVIGDARLALQGLLDELGSDRGARAAEPGWGVERAASVREAVTAGVAPGQRAVRDDQAALDQAGAGELVPREGQPRRAIALGPRHGR